MKKIKILFFIENLYEGGAEKVLCNLVNQMNQTKFEITVQTVWPCDSDKYLRPGIHYKTMYRTESRVNKFRYRVDAATGLAYELYIKNDYDIEVAYLECGPTKVIAKSTNQKAKKVAWVHSDFSVAHDRRFAKKTKKYYEKYDKVVCVSRKCLESFRDYFGEEIQSTIVHNVVDVSEIIRKSEESLPESIQKRRFTICSVGRLTVPKNYIRLIKTVDRLNQNGYRFDTWIVGDGDQRSVLEKMIKESKSGNHIKLLGFQENPYPYMREADLLVSSSSYEGFSTFVTEGIVLGKPILTTECSGMHEILDGYKKGMIVENSDEAFYRGLKRLVTVQNDKIRLDNYSVSNRIIENEDFFEALLQ